MVGVSHVQTNKYIELGRKLEVEVCEQAVTAEVGVNHNTRFVVHACIGHVAHVFGTAGQLHVGFGNTSQPKTILPPVGSVVIEGVQRVLHNGINLPVATHHVSIAPQVVHTSVKVVAPSPCVCIVVRHHNAVGCGVVVCRAVFLGQHQGNVAFGLSNGLFGRCGQPRHRLRYVYLYFVAPGLTLFGGDEDNAVTCTRTIERCRGGIFQHLHALDTGWVQSGKGVNATHVLGVVGHGHAVYHVKRRSIVCALLVERAKSTYGYLRTATTWRTRQVGNVYTGNTSLQQVFKARRGHFL